ncbi:alpha/beta hydrolase [Glycomyces dulcitolivorans]|uniref:alpha/beta hydrolase n=1 Tax=Glycomyces dulcitolivorans TaxID=2200759 RepID=UPI000DD38686|nr:alpha/beta hydrolase [Glycomyces dulcitolivorans]
MSVTYSALRDADFGPLAAVGEQWRAQAGRLEERESELDDLRRRQIGEAQWTGTVAEEVRSRVKLIGDDTVERAGECRRIAAAIEDAVEVFKDRQEELLELLASLPEGLSVDADGVVTGEAADVAAFESRIEGILEAVGEADETLHAAVAAIAGTADAGERAELAAGVALADDFQDMLDRGSSPAAVNAWWDGLSPFEQQGLLESRPELLAQVDGIPSGVRDSANRTLLDGELHRRESEIENVEDRLAVDPGNQDLQKRLEGLRGTQEDLTRLRDTVSEPYQVGAGGPALDHYLLGYSSAEDGRAIVAIGNPDTADNVSVLVPGTGADLGNVGGSVDRAALMAGDAYWADPNASTASVLWLGYDAPDEVVPHAMDKQYAEDAAQDLSSFAAGLRAVDEDGESHLTVTGHSYGSTTVGIAARDAGLDVDDMVFVGSPGVGVDSASDLGIDPDRVWATRNEEDIIGWAREDTIGSIVGGGAGGLLGGPVGGLIGGAVGYFTSDHDDLVHGTDPVSDAFGGRTFKSDATRDADGLDELWKDNADNHSSYWDGDNGHPRNAARDNMAYIVTGQTSGVR